jgi:pyruvate,orthophosphate dikinase
MLGEVQTIQPEMSGEFARLMTWADRHRTMKVRTNADTPGDCQTARDFGAEGVGLCRTEHMFFDAGRIVAVREMILAATAKGRRKALDKILPMQRQDFMEIFRIMAGLPVTIRLLDPPLHEFLPHEEAAVVEVAEAAGLPVDQVRARALKLEEVNPMLGHRGCRLAITYPEIYQMQARAIFEAALEVARESGAAVHPEVMIPLIAMSEELKVLRELVEEVAREVLAGAEDQVLYEIGTMIELPRACLRAREIAELADFFSFGTNDLTQTTYGLSRDDAANFISAYENRGILERDPFISLDAAGVGELVAIGVERGRAGNPKLHMGICGEHGGDPASIAECQRLGLDYVSCSPFRVPIARLAAAQAALAAKSGQSVGRVAATA